MALKRRFRPKKNVKISTSQPKPAPALKLVKGAVPPQQPQSPVQPPPPANAPPTVAPTQVAQPTPLGAGPTDREVELNQTSTGDQKRRLIVHHRINELYQDKNLTMEQLLQGLLEITTEALNAEGGSLWLHRPERKEIECSAAIGPGSDKIINLSIPEGKGVVGWTHDNNKSTIVYDAATDERFYSKADRAQKNFSTKSLIASPLYYQGEVIGVFEVLNKKTLQGSFNDGDMHFLEDICTPAAMHIKTSMTMMKQSVLLRQLHSLGELHETFSSTMNLDELLSLVLDKACDFLEAEVGSIWLTDETGQKITCKIANGDTKDKIIGVSVDNGQGLIGWVVDKQKPSIVEDCSKDPRFTTSVDKKTGFVTKSLIAAPLSVKGEAIGAIEIINKKGKRELFDQEDLELTMLFASSSAMYIKNARLFESEKKANELSALINISKEITSTLDLDSVLMSIVNLSSDIVDYDAATISITRPGEENQFDVRAISGEQHLDKETDEYKKLNELHNKIAEIGNEILITDLKSYASYKDCLPELKNYLEENQIESFWAYVMQDDQGKLGVLTMEAEKPNIINKSNTEMLSILVAQCTVAIRNAELYTTIPSNNMISKFKENVIGKLMTFPEWPKEKQMMAGGGVLATLLSLIFLKVPYNVDANIEIVPMTTSLYSQSRGSVKNILVKEGQTVNPGDVLLQLDLTEIILQQRQKLSTRQKVVSEMIKLQTEGRIAEYKIKEQEKLSLDSELQLIDKQLQQAEIKSSVNGVVVSEKLDELIGMPVDFGQELIKIARSDRVYAQFQIHERDVPHVQPGQNVKFKVFGHPNHSFGEKVQLVTVAGEAKQILETDPTKYFIAAAEIPTHADGVQLLRPGMTGRGKVYTPWEPLGYFLFLKPYRFIVMDLLF